MINFNKLDKFKSKFVEIREVVLDLLPNNEGLIDAVIAPVFFVVLANFVDLNTAIFSTGGLLIIFLIYRRLKKQDLKFVFYGFIGSAIALLLARLQGVLLVFHSWNYKRRNNSNLWINFDTNKKAIYHI